MAGVGGFEPPNGGVRVRCLTAWRHPKSRMWFLTKKPLGVKSFSGRLMVLAKGCKSFFQTLDNPVTPQHGYNVENPRAYGPAS